MKTHCQKKRAQELMISFALAGATTTAAGMALQKPMPKTGAMLTGFGTANLLLSGMYFLTQQ